MKEFCGASERIASLSLQLSRKFILNIIQVYAPTSACKDKYLKSSYKNDREMCGIQHPPVPSLSRLPQGILLNRNSSKLRSH